MLYQTDSLLQMNTALIVKFTIVWITSAYRVSNIYMKLFHIGILPDQDKPEQKTAGIVISRPFFSVLSSSDITFIISYIISVNINQIPFINKYIL